MRLRVTASWFVTTNSLKAPATRLVHSFPGHRVPGWKVAECSTVTQESAARCLCIHLHRVGENKRLRAITPAGEADRKLQPTDACWAGLRACQAQLARQWPLLSHQHAQQRAAMVFLRAWQAAARKLPEDLGRRWPLLS